VRIVNRPINEEFMRDHIKILGILNIVMGSLTACIGLFVLIALGGVAGILGLAGVTGSDNSGALAAPILTLIGFCVAIFFLVLGLPSIIGGWGLIKLRPWARVVMIVVSAFHLLHVPLGTALGVYGLWVLLSDEGRLALSGESQGGFSPAVPTRY
jgi:hypothetical protein